MLKKIPTVLAQAEGNPVGLTAVERDVFYRRILPINRLSAQSWGAFYHVHKEILRQRGAIRTAKVPGPVVPLDEAARRDVQAVIDQLYPS